MENHLHGRLTTLNRLKEIRDNPKVFKYHRQGADKNIQKILKQLKDPKLMRMRERLLKATQARDLAEVHKIENQMRDYEGREKENE